MKLSRNKIFQETKIELSLGLFLAFFRSVYPKKPGGFFGNLLWCLNSLKLRLYGTLQICVLLLLLLLLLYL